MTDGWVTPQDWPAGRASLTSEEIDQALANVTEETAERARALIQGDEGA